MAKSSVLSQTNLDDLLQWLDPDRERAGQRYEQIRRSLIKIFAARGCHEAESLADETLTRVAHKVNAIAATYEGNPNLFFYGVAKNVHREYLKNRLREVAPEVRAGQNRTQNSLASSYAAPSEETPNEARLECLRKCLRTMVEDEREILTKYYEDEKGAKIISRRALAEQHRMSVNALRLKAYRLRQSLKQCVLKCMEISLT